MTAKRLWQEGLSQLKKLSETPSLDSLLLVCSALGIDKESYWREPEQIVCASQYNKFSSLLAERCQKKPIAYLLKEKEFWGRTFFVDERVLIPRPDTEILVKTALDILQEEPRISRVIDVGTGSGAIGLSISAQLKGKVSVELTDVSSQALEVALFNQQTLKCLSVKMHCCHLLDCYKTIPPYTLVLANLPYLSESECLIKNRNYPWEPLMALYGGKNKGLNLIEELLGQLKNKYLGTAWLILEASSWQVPFIWRRMEELTFSELKIHKDLSGQDRLISGRL